MSTVAQQSEARQIPNMAGKVMTVRGPIDPSELGTTIMHEHVFIDLRKAMRPDYYTPATDAALWDENPRVTLDNLHLTHFQLTIGRRPIGDNALFWDEKVAIAEATYFRDAGGNTIVDVTSKGLHPDPLALRRVSYATGLNIIMGSGWYQKRHHPDDMDQLTVEGMTEEIIRDVTLGVGGTGVRSGVIGEVGIEGNPLTPNELKSIRASARASKATGAAISFHRSGIGRDEKLKVVGTVAEEGGDLTRTILGHSDWIAMDLPLMKELLEMGPFIEFDLLGRLDVPLTYLPSVAAPPTRGWSLGAVVTEGILGLIEAGYEDRILLSHDTFPKHNLRSYGGVGWTFILEKFLPHLRALGVTEEQINKFMVHNPRRALTFAEPR